MQPVKKGEINLPAFSVLIMMSSIIDVSSQVVGIRNDSIYTQLRQKIQFIPLVDSHCHIPAPSTVQQRFADKSFKYDILWVLCKSTYVAEFIYGSNWEETKKALQINAHHAYYRPILEAFRELYGLPRTEELNDNNVELVSARMDSAHRQSGWQDEVIKRANVSQILWVINEPLTKTEAPAPYYHIVWNIDALVYVTGATENKETKEKSYNIDTVQKNFSVTFKSLTDFVAFMQEKITNFFTNGGVGLKTTSAYFRALDFNDAVPREEAVRVFDKVLRHQPVSAPEQKTLEDYLMTQILSLAAKHKKPFQFHTGNQQGWSIVSHSNPLGLNALLYSGKWYEVKFILLHGGYPYIEESVMLSKYYKNVYLDLAWMALYSPSAARRALSDAIDMLDGRQLMFGTDTANLEEFYGTAKFIRTILAEVLAEKIASGFLTEEIALQIARRILSTNALELYEIDTE
ncbi:MAG: amidohydrolase family protein [bacterium]